MQITIIGTDKVYLWKIKPKNKNKRFFKINNQMYKALRSELTRLYRKKYDEWAPTDEIIIFRENRIIPYHSNGTTSYAQDDLLAEIDAVKFAYRKKIGWGLWGKVSGSGGWLWPALVLGISAILVIGAFMK